MDGETKIHLTLAEQEQGITWCVCMCACACVGGTCGSLLNHRTCTVHLAQEARMIGPGMYKVSIRTVAPSM